MLSKLTPPVHPSSTPACRPHGPWAEADAHQVLPLLPLQDIRVGAQAGRGSSLHCMMRPCMAPSYAQAAGKTLAAPDTSAHALCLPPSTRSVAASPYVLGGPEVRKVGEFTEFAFEVSYIGAYKAPAYDVPDIVPQCYSDLEDNIHKLILDTRECVRTAALRCWGCCLNVTWAGVRGREVQLWLRCGAGLHKHGCHACAALRVCILVPTRLHLAHPLLACAALYCPALQRTTAWPPGGTVAM